MTRSAEKPLDGITPSTKTNTRKRMSVPFWSRPMARELAKITVRARNSNAYTLRTTRVTVVS
jgi:hypothetical protein